MNSAEYQAKYGKGKKKKSGGRSAPAPILPSDCPVPLLKNQIYFYGNVPSLKNGKDIFCKGPKGKPLKRAKVLPNAECEQFLNHFALQQVLQYKNWLKIINEVAIKDLKKFILFYQFIRPSKRSTFDYSNAIEILQDGLTGKVYIPQRKGAKNLKYCKKVENVPNVRKYLQWIPEDNNTRTVPAFHPVDLYYPKSPGVIISFFPTFKEYVNFLVDRRIGI